MRTRVCAFCVRLRGLRLRTRGSLLPPRSACLLLSHPYPTSLADHVGWSAGDVTKPLILHRGLRSMVATHRMWRYFWVTYT